MPHRSIPGIKMNVQCPHGDPIAVWTCFSQHCQCHSSHKQHLRKRLKPPFSLCCCTLWTEVATRFKTLSFSFYFSFFYFRPVFDAIYIFRPAMFWYVVHLHLHLRLMRSQCVSEHLVRTDHNVSSTPKEGELHTFWSSFNKKYCLWKNKNINKINSDFFLSKNWTAGLLYFKKKKKLMKKFF